MPMVRRIVQRAGTVLRRVAGPAISVAVLVAAVTALRHVDFAQARALVPHGIGFWIVFVAGYLALPVADWVIFRRLFDLRLSGLLPLLRKLVANELLLGYSGEVYFYGWVRANVPATAAPFGAIKDVSILSALVGNVATLLVLCAGLPFANRVGIDRLGAGTTAASAAVLLVVTLVSLWLGGRIFSLPTRDLRFVAAAHLVRFTAASALTAILWHLCLPAVPVSVWIVLSGLRLLLARLPFVSNADLVFAGCAAVVLGRNVPITGVIAMLATITVIAHVAVGLALIASMAIDHARKAAAQRSVR
ncbi:hypothetical protein OLX02_03515 [Novosphingobium sp. KCTC 2891]|uniref:hypothetical protein n=1 Tax=Novosphingobium sp. KCTC 2891 TaxID=2989730 RepID=UPI0022213C6B|nr:hypothetical protein [Novosphingobium sp. KCTC 2891]MCW1381884.1 hypothetical protein [Novosphingobium sp. KCTC 2891]